MRAREGRSAEEGSGLVVSAAGAPGWLEFSSVPEDSSVLCVSQSCMGRGPGSCCGGNPMKLGFGEGLGPGERPTMSFQIPLESTGWIRLSQVPLVFEEEKVPGQPWDLRREAIHRAGSSPGGTQPPLE